MLEIRTVVCLIAAAWLVSPAQAAPLTQDQLRQRAQAMCANDVVTRCGDEASDDVKAAACLKRHIGQVSADCRKAMKAAGG